ncbi:Subunit of the glycosylphosphatidylinositol transamidase complex-like protein [Clydaea vesicula]|uniref:Subunit of the glycosylphosphatidylinositol transamidase complex-like protein n=1 Tax=Clydaea vesicula TaxID=447962 RepID=A0AAD5U608_9FUNG|nr:Subunit of the glycosylphosphatidylinositol transamidase complex-like protein [Clydaea vesicula]
MAGISTLFNAYKLFDANFHSAGVHLKPVCNRNDDFNSDLTKNYWSLNKIFERKIPKACAVSSKSLVELSLPNKTGFKLNNSPDKILDNGNFIFDLQNKIDFDIGVEWESNQELNFGFGQEKGGINIDLYNYRDQPLTVAVFQMIPWYLKFYLHTLQFQSMPLNHDFNAESLILRNRDILNETYYQPAVERMRPTILEYKLSLPAKSKIVMKMDFDKSFIRYTEHPPDANRGFDIGPAIITFGKKEEKFYTNNLLINLPTPDFSMPYNVITLTCTVLAFLFAGIFNLMIKNYKPV